MSDEIDDDEAMGLIDECWNFGDSLTDWEANFLDSISEQLDGGRRLTDRQFEVLEKIADEVPQR